MRRNLMIGLSLVAGACMPTPANVAPSPASGAAACTQETASSVMYFVDGIPLMCTAAMAVPTSRIASVEVLKGEVALALYGVAPTGGVVSIQTKK